MTTLSINGSTRRRRIYQRVFQIIVTIVFLLFALFPILWIVSASLDPRNSLATQQIIPSEMSFDNYTNLFTDPVQPFTRWMINS